MHTLPCIYTMWAEERIPPGSTCCRSALRPCWAPICRHQAEIKRPLDSPPFLSIFPPYSSLECVFACLCAWTHAVLRAAACAPGARGSEVFDLLAPLSLPSTPSSHSSPRPPNPQEAPAALVDCDLVLCCAVLCRTMSCCAVPWWSASHCTTLLYHCCR